MADQQRRERAEPAHAASTDLVLDRLQVDPDAGLDRSEVDRRRAEHGANELREMRSRAWWLILVDQLRSMVVYLLGAAAILAFITRRWPEGIAVTAVIAVNTTIGFVSEWRAVRSMAALRRLGAHRTRVRRDGRPLEIAAADLVPGDVLLLDAGDLVPADARLLEAERLQVNEATLTGESVPVDKTVEPVPADAVLAERRCMLFKGTSVANGSAIAVVVATGPSTELGRIAELAEGAEAGVAPLQQRLDRMGHRLAWLTLGIALLVAAVGVLVRRQETTLVIETALALGIAAIPEGLPIVATIALARGMYVMARRDALVNRLAAVETLGATGVIFTDKTGTLTQNSMRLQTVLTPAGEHRLDEMSRDAASPALPEGDESLEAMRRVIEVGVLCNAASIEQHAHEDNPAGDPTEIALLEAGRRIGLHRDALLDRRPLARTEEFEPRVKKMATFHERDGDVFEVSVKGAPEAVLDVCDRIAASGGDQPLDDATRSHWREEADRLAGEGLRVLAMAAKTTGSRDDEPYADLRFLGLVGLLDPPREGVKQAIDRCQAAGIRVAMVTGDQPATARAIARAVGIVGDPEDPEAVVMHGRDIGEPDTLDDEHRERIHHANIFARVSPEQKLDLVCIYQERGEIVAMTGDGVNDAPALKKADIGVAMGRRGTEAAKQMADMVLKDDSFHTIVAAVEQGRVIFANIRTSAMFMLCTNVAEVIAVTVATFAGWTLPLLPLQILYLNVLTDVFPALALGIGPGSGNEMRRPPRDPEEAVLTARHWLSIIGWAVLVASCVLLALLAAERWLGLAASEAVTVSFLTLAFGKLWFVFNLRDRGSPILRNEITRSPWVWASIGLCSALLLAAVYAPVLQSVLGTSDPGWRGWALLLAASGLPLVIGQTLLALSAIIRSGRADRPAT